MYGELSAEQQHELELFISQHADLKQELEELTSTKSLLQHLPVQSPAEQLVMMEPEKAPPATSAGLWSKVSAFLIPNSGFARTGFAMATFVVLIFAMGSFTNMNISMGNGGFSLTFGEQAPVQTGYTAAQVELIINQVQQENAQLISNYIQSAQEQQDDQFQQTLAAFMEYVNDQRAEDLMYINNGLASLEENTYNRFRYTDQVLGEIIQTVSTND